MTNCLGNSCSFVYCACLSLAFISFCVSFFSLRFQGGLWDLIVLSLTIAFLFTFHLSVPWRFGMKHI